ncbi:MAG TPA: c-type cytochrome [Sphingomicrobium sp.]|nr:c-type cytochrome [Sphingomicrobium sp.]
MQKAVLLLALAGLSACGSQSEEVADQQAEVKPAQLTFDGADYKDEAAKIAHGKRLASVLDCTGCHGENLQGTNVTKDDPAYGDMNAPNITLMLAKYSDADLDQLIRHGKPKGGREFWFMPVESLQFLSDADLAALIAYLRTFKPAGEQRPPIRKGPKFLKDVENGLYGNAQQQIARYQRESPPDMGASHKWGRHLARTVCTPCHNSQLQGYADFTPDLDIAGAYTPAELETLLTTGKGKSKPDLGLMAMVAKNSLSKLTSRERAAIIAYVQARANRPQNPQ